MICQQQNVFKVKCNEIMSTCSELGMDLEKRVNGMKVPTWPSLKSDKTLQFSFKVPYLQLTSTCFTSCGIACANFCNLSSLISAVPFHKDAPPRLKPPLPCVCSSASNCMWKIRATVPEHYIFKCYCPFITSVCIQH